MEKTTDESLILAQVYEEVRQRFGAIHDSAHGWEHVDRVYQLAQSIAEREGADRFIVGMAALLHDLGRIAEHHTNGHHADISVELATTLLQAYQVAANRQQAILHAILAHSFSRKVEPETLEACVVRDADRLDGLGAIGILRWAITGAVRQTPQSYDPDDPFAEQHTPDDQRYFLDHFYTKLLKLNATMMTETGRTLAQQRTAFMHTYLAEFRRELSL